MSESQRKAALVVDDDDAVRGIIVEILTAMGHHPVYEAHDGEEGFKTLKQHFAEIAIVVSDWEMPRMKGIDLLAMVREDAEVSSVPFLMVTSQTSLEMMKVQMAIAAEVDHYLMKPFTAVDLRTKVELILKKVAEDHEEGKGLKAGFEAMLDKRYTDAANEFRQVLIVRPKSVSALLGLAQVLLQQDPKNFFDQALSHIDEAIAINPRMPGPYVELAAAYEKMLQFEKALSALKRGIPSNAKSPDLFYHMARILANRRRYNEAFVALERALTINPDFAEAKKLKRMLAQNK